MKAQRKIRDTSPPPLPVRPRPVNQACAIGPGGACLACSARQGEPCRHPSLGS